MLKIRYTWNLVQKRNADPDAFIEWYRMQDEAEQKLIMRQAALFGYAKGLAAVIALGTLSVVGMFAVIGLLYVMEYEVEQDD